MPLNISFAHHNYVKRNDQQFSRFCFATQFSQQFKASLWEHSLPLELQLYQVVEKVVSVDDFLRLREVSGLTPRPYDAAKRALPNSLFGVQVVIDNHTVGMGRVVGDGALNFEVVDIAVEPIYQGKGVGRMIMQSIMGYLDRDAPKGA